MYNFMFIPSRSCKKQGPLFAIVFIVTLFSGEFYGRFVSGTFASLARS